MKSLLIKQALTQIIPKLLIKIVPADGIASVGTMKDMCVCSAPPELVMVSSCVYGEHVLSFYVWKPLQTSFPLILFYVPCYHGYKIHWESIMFDNKKVYNNKWYLFRYNGYTVITPRMLLCYLPSFPSLVSLWPWLISCHGICCCRKNQWQCCLSWNMYVTTG